jgi:hypothetical protein
VDFVCNAETPCQTSTPYVVVWFGWRYKSTLALGFFGLDSSTRCAFESFSSLASFGCPSHGFSSYSYVSSIFYATLDSTLIFPTLTSLGAPVGPSCSGREISHNAVFFFLYQIFKKIFCTLTLTITTNFIQE